MLPTPALELDPPGTYVFDVDAAVRGRVLNRFAASLRDPARRAEFTADEGGTMQSAGLGPDVRELVHHRDWSGLVQAGGHLQLVLLIAHALEQSLWDIGAHQVGCSPAELIEACPRIVHGLPNGWIDEWHT